MQTGGIFLNERSERVASLGQFAFLAQFRRGLKFRQADVRRRLGRNVAALLVTHGDLLFKTPCEVASLAVKFLLENPECEKNARHCRREKLSRQLWILDTRGAALWAANKGRGDARIGSFPLDHEVLRLLEIFFFHLHFYIRQRL